MSNPFKASSYYTPHNEVVEGIMFLTGPDFRPSSLPCEHSTLYIPWPILTKVGIQLVYGKVENPIDFQGQGQNWT